MGNHPSTDLMVRSPQGEWFAVEVKGLYKKNDWPVRQQKTRNNLFYVFAFVPTGMPNRFFVLTQSEVNNGMVEDLERAEKAAKMKGRQRGIPFNV